MFALIRFNSATLVGQLFTDRNNLKHRLSVLCGYFSSGLMFLLYLLRILCFIKLKTVKAFLRRKMEDEDVFLSVIYVALASVTYLIRTRKKKRTRRYGVRPINRRRKELRMYNNLIKAMINHDQEYFFKYTIISPELFSNLLRLVEPKLTKFQSTRNPITAGQRLIITLHYLAEGCSQQELAFGYYVGIATVSKIIKETVAILYDVLQPIVIPVPTQKDWTQIAEGFWKRWNIPNCVGAIDGKHIQIKCPPGSSSRYYNYKKHFSLVLMAACDAFYKFTLVDVGGEGSNSDGAIFRQSGFGYRLLTNKIHLPPSKCLPHSNIELPHFMVADAAFPLHTNIMRSYPGSYLGVEKNIFNYRLSRARRVIENTFGILTHRWRIYFKPVDALLDTIENIVLCTVALHNYIQKSEEDMPINRRKYSPTGYIDVEKDNGNVSFGNWRQEKQPLRKVGRLGANNSKRTAQDNRDILKNYFLSPGGCIPWQFDHVMEGQVPNNFTMSS